MEFLEGETLTERLKKGPLPLEQVLRYSIEIADALDEAHRAGVTHRDINLGNVMLTKEGTKPGIPISTLRKGKGTAVLHEQDCSRSTAVTLGECLWKVFQRSRQFPNVSMQPRFFIST